jgi:hypothetical protein
MPLANAHEDIENPENRFIALPLFPHELRPGISICVAHAIKALERFEFRRLQ